MRLICISLAQSFAHCSQAVGGGCSWGVGEDGDAGEGGGEGSEYAGGDTGITEIRMGDFAIVVRVWHTYDVLKPNQVPQSCG